MIPFRKSIGFRLLSMSFILLALPLLVDSFIFIHNQYYHAISDGKNYLIESTKLKQLALSQMQPFKIPIVQMLSNYLKLEENFPQEPNKELDKKLQALAEVGDFYSIFLIKVTPEQRYVVVAAGREEYLGKDYTDFFELNEIFSPAYLEKGYSAYLMFDLITNRLYFVIVYPIFFPGDNNSLQGILLLSDSISEDLTTILQPQKNFHNAHFALLLPSSIVFAASDPDLMFQYFYPLDPDVKKLFIEQLPFAAQRLPANPIERQDGIGAPFFEFTWQGEQQIGYVSRMPDANYSVLTYASRQAIFRAPLLMFLNIYGTYGLILLIGGILATMATMRMAKPIQNLSEVMRHIQKGELNYRYRPHAFGFEINTLGQIFNQTVDAVLEQKSKTEEERVEKETLASELRLGQQVQRSLLPQTMPLYPGVELAEIYIPAIEVGGDFFDAFVKEKKGERELVLAVADASGKGVSACFYSLSVRNMLRTYANESPNIAKAMSATNNLFIKDTADTGMFITVIGAIYNYKTHTLDYYSCGHNPGLIKYQEGGHEFLKSGGIAMGVFEFEEEKPNQVTLKAGDMVIFYSDGITEAHNELYEIFGEERLAACVEDGRGRSAAETVRRIIECVNDFVGDAQQHDDITLLVMKIVE